MIKKKKKEGKNIGTKEMNAYYLHNSYRMTIIFLWNRERSSKSSKLLLTTAS